LKLPLLGDHQIENASLAVMAAYLLSQNHFKIKIEDIYHGIFDVNWPGRMQVLGHNPKVVVDVAHNPDGILKLIHSIRNTFIYNDLSVVLGVVKNKNYQAMIKLICLAANRLIAVQPATHRALEIEKITNVAQKYSIPVHKFDNVAAGLNYALSTANKNTLVLGTGSHYTVGEIINSYKST
jgi:dihydrofolate synthase/folylpolyglutamate synthase